MLKTKQNDVSMVSVPLAVQLTCIQNPTFSSTRSESLEFRVVRTRRAARMAGANVERPTGDIQMNLRFLRFIHGCFPFL